MTVATPLASRSLCQDTIASLSRVLMAYPRSGGDHAGNEHGNDEGEHHSFSRLG
jgi:hypothetical protein